ncbi:MAG: InlB B-repeat-containing protein, partial [Acetivibrio sp.]
MKNKKRKIGFLILLFLCIGMGCLQYTKTKEVKAATTYICNVIYMSNGGTEIPGQIYNQGTTLSSLPAPVREGYIFGGWYMDESLTKPMSTSYFFPVQGMDSVLVLFAKWQKAGIRSIIATYKNQSEIVGTILEKDSIKVNVIFSDGTMKLVTDYTIGDLKVANIGVNMFRVTYENITTTFYVIGKQERFFTLTFITNGGTSIAPISGMKEGNNISLPAEPTKGGYSFEGWYQDSALKTPITKDTKVLNNMVLFAKWSKIEIIEEKVHYELNTNHIQLKLNTQAALFIPSYNGDIENYVNYSSSRNEIATVNESGIITGHRQGTAIIYVVAPDGSVLKCKVQVSAGPLIKKLSLKSSSKKMKIKENYKIK